MTHSFSIKEALRFGWDKTRAHSGLLFKVMITIFAVQVASSIVEKVLEGTVRGFFATVLLLIIGVVVGIGFTHIALKLAKGESAVYRDILPPAKLGWDYVLASFLTGLIIFGGLILLIIPGIYFALRYMFVRFAVLEGTGVMGSLRQSAKMTVGIKWKLLGFGLVMIGVNILGFLALMVGLLITIPLTLIAYAHVYDVLKKNVEVKA